MPVINLRTHYPHYKEDIFIEVSDEVAEVILLSIRQKNNYDRRMYRYKAHYSLDVGDGIEHDALYSAPSPEEILMQKTSLEQLYDALHHLPHKQAHRVHAHYILGENKAQIARCEGISGSCICGSVQSGVKNLRRYFEQKKWLP